jgi:hypothetical protein
MSSFPCSSSARNFSNTIFLFSITLSVLSARTQALHPINALCAHQFAFVCCKTLSFGHRGPDSRALCVGVSCLCLLSLPFVFAFCLCLLSLPFGFTYFLLQFLHTLFILTWTYLWFDTHPSHLSHHPPSPLSISFHLTSSHLILSLPSFILHLFLLIPLSYHAFLIS